MDLRILFLRPIENSLAGSVHRSYDLLIASGLHIQAEVVIPICAQSHWSARGRSLETFTQGLFASGCPRAVRTIFSPATLQ